MAFAALGNDTGGSVRIPAAFCGIVGIKPTFGRISRYGVVPLDFSLDHVGVLARNVPDTATILNSIAGRDPRDESSSRHRVDNYVPTADSKLSGLRLGWPKNLETQRIDRDVRAALDNATLTAEQLGIVITPVEVPDYAALNAVHRVILHSEVSAIMKPFLSQRDKFSSDLLALLHQGLLLSGTDYVNAQRYRTMALNDYRSILQKVDFLIGPTTPIPPPLISEDTVSIDGVPEDVRLATTRLARIANLMGLPAISLPCAFTRSGLPIGLQITGRPFEEASIFRISRALENALGCCNRIPAIASSFQTTEIE